MKHTEGPWTIKSSKANLAAGAPTDNEIRCGNMVIVRLGTFYTQEQEANARLIAAAPDLLEALRPLAKQDCESHDCPLQQARAAIAKAEGKEESHDTA